MKVIAVISSKGGVMKSGLSIALAVAFEKDGKKTTILDLDPQASSSFWKDIRESNCPTVTAIPSTRLSSHLDASKESGYDTVIIDTPPSTRDVSYEAAVYADFILIPTRPAILDIESVTKTIYLIKQLEKHCAIILTFCEPLSKEVIDAEDVIKKLDVPLCPVKIGNRIDYSRALQHGLSAQEFNPKGKAANEISDLYKFICTKLKRSKRK